MRDERAVSTTLGYALSLAIATVLVSGLLIAGGNVVEDQREKTTRTELRVIGQQIAADVAAADRLVRTDGTDTVVVGRSLPEAVSGTDYTVAVHAGGGDPYLVLSTDSPAVSVRVNAPSRTDVVPTTVTGGDVRIVYDAANDELEVERD